MSKKTFRALGNVVCKLRNGRSTSIQLSTIDDIRATTKRGGEQQAKRTWKSRGELPVPGMKRKARCVVHASVEEPF